MQSSKCTNYLLYFHTTVRLWAQWQRGACYYVVCVTECNFIQSNKLWQEFGVALKYAHSVGLGLLLFYECVCVYKLRHGHLNTACLPTAVLSNSSEMWVLQRVSSLRPGATERLQKTRTSVSVCHGRHVWFTSLPSTLSALVNSLII